jgi:hypothetical protein
MIILMVVEKEKLPEDDIRLLLGVNQPRVIRQEAKESSQVNI